MPSPKADKEWYRAVRKAVHELRAEKDAKGKIKKTKAINMLAKTLVTAAINGDMAALKEVGDRLDGKPRQTVEATGQGGGPMKLTVEYVRSPSTDS